MHGLEGVIKGDGIFSIYPEELFSPYSGLEEVL